MNLQKNQYGNRISKPVPGTGHIPSDLPMPMSPHGSIFNPQMAGSIPGWVYNAQQRTLQDQQLYMMLQGRQQAMRGHGGGVMTRNLVNTRFSYPPYTHGAVPGRWDGQRHTPAQPLY